MPGLLSKKDEDLTITRKGADGTTVTIKNPAGSQMDMLGLLGGMVEGSSPTPVADNVPAMLTAGEFVVNQPATMKYGGLLQKINQEGRNMLAAGGWVDKPKPMGYNQGGYAGYSPQQFLSEAQRVNTPGAQSPVFGGQGFTPNTPAPAPQPAQPVGVQEALPEVPKPADAVDVKVAQTTPEQVKEQAEAAGVPVAPASLLADAIGGSQSHQEALAKIDAQVDQLSDKRQKAQYLAFGLSMLSGNGINSSINAAEKIGRLTTPELDRLLADRQTILQSAATEGRANAAAKLTGTGGATSTGPSSVYDKKRIDSFVDSAREAKDTASKATQIADRIEKHGGAAGYVGKAAELYKGIIGAQGDVSAWKTDFEGFVNSEVVNNLPPGVASDRDIDLIKGGFPNNSWNKEQLTDWLRAYSNVAEAKAMYDDFAAKHLDKGGSRSGIPEAFAASFGSESKSAPSADTSFDYDFSQ